MTKANRSVKVVLKKTSPVTKAAILAATEQAIPRLVTG